MIETNTLKDATIITGFKNDFITNVLRTTKDYYEFAMLDFIRNNVKRGVMVDVGANIGNHTIFLAKYCATHVLSFEPFDSTFELLEKNIIQNNIENVKCVVCGLSNEKKEVYMKSVPGNAGMNKICDDGNLLVQVFPLDSIITTQGEITLIKLDCEGYEEKALLGMIGAIKVHKPALFIECQTETELNSISNILLPLGYSNKKRFNSTPTYFFSI